MGQSYVNEWWDVGLQSCSATGGCTPEERQQSSALLAPSIVHLERALQLGESWVNFYLGIALREADVPGVEYPERLKRSVECLREAVRLEPNSDAVNRELGIALLRDLSHKELARGASTTAGTDAEDLLRLERQSALLYLHQATLLDPKNGANWLAYSEEMVKQGRSAEARMEIDTVAAQYLPPERLRALQGWVDITEELAKRSRQRDAR
jgi:hypothetical protein